MNKVKYIIIYGNRAGHNSPSVLVRRVNSERWHEKQLTDATAQRLQRVLCTITPYISIVRPWIAVTYWM